MNQPVKKIAQELDAIVDDGHGNGNGRHTSPAEGVGQQHYTAFTQPNTGDPSLLRQRIVEEDRFSRQVVGDILASGDNKGRATERILTIKGDAIANESAEDVRHKRIMNEIEEQTKRMDVLKAALDTLDPEQQIRELNKDVDESYGTYSNAYKNAKSEFIASYSKDWGAMLTFAASFLVSVLSFGYTAYILTENAPTLFKWAMIIFSIFFAAASSYGRKFLIFLTAKEPVKPGRAAKNTAILSAIADGAFEILAMPSIIARTLGQQALDSLGGWVGVFIMVVLIEVPCYIITRNLAKEHLELVNEQAIRLREKKEVAHGITKDYFSMLANRIKDIPKIVSWALPQALSNKKA